MYAKPIRRLRGRTGGEIKSGLGFIHDRDLVGDLEKITPNSAAVVRKKLAGRILSVDYRIVEDRRQVNSGSEKIDSYHLAVAHPAEIVAAILKFPRDYIQIHQR